jgi:hypothetical protein
MKCDLIFGNDQFRNGNREIGSLEWPFSATVQYSCSGVKIHGVLYKCGSIIRVTSNDNTEDLPFTYVQIKKVYYVHLDHKIFVTNIVQVCEFVQPLRALNIVITEQPLLCLSTRLYCHGVLHLKHHNNSLYLVEKDHWRKHSAFYWLTSSSILTII